MREPEFELIELAPGVRLHAARATRWKTTLAVARISASLAEDPTRSALVPFVSVRGTERSPSARALARRLEALYDAELEPDVVRLGDVQVLEWRLDVAHPRFSGGRADTLREGLALLGEVLYRPTRAPSGALPADVVQGEKKNLRTEIEGLRDERTEYAIERAARLLGRGAPSGRYELGAVEDLPAIGPGDLLARWETLGRAHPLDLLVVGDHDPREIEGAAREALPLERRAPHAETVELPPLAVAPAPPGRAPAREVERARVEQAHVCLGYRARASYLGPGYAAATIFHCVLGADAHSRLFLGVRERLGLAYEAGTIFDRPKCTITAHCGTDPANVERIEREVEAEVARLREELVPEGELREARRFAVERAREMVDDPGLAIAFEHTRTLAGRRDVSLAALVRAFEEVTAEDVREAARALALDCVYVLTKKGAG